MELIVRDFSFDVIPTTSLDGRTVRELTEAYTIYKSGRGKYRKKLIAKPFYIEGKRSITFHINGLQPFLSRCRRAGIDVTTIKITENFRKPYIDKNFPKLQPTGFEERQYQSDYVDIIVNDKSPQMLVDLQTGKGKTYIALKGLSILSERLYIQVLPLYISKWINDIKKNLLATDDDIYVIQGSDSIKKLLKMKDIPPIIIGANKTMLNYMKSYMTGDDEYIYGVGIKDFLSYLNISIMLIDEVHQEFQNQMRITQMLSPRKLIALSATLNNYDADEQRMYNRIFNRRDRHKLLEYDAYIALTGVSYFISNKVRLKTELDGSYTHSEFEKSICRDPMAKIMYFDMINSKIEEWYKFRQEEDKCLIFMTNVKTVEMFKEYLEVRYPQLAIGKYTEVDPLETIMTSNITVSTLKSSGTALDIPGLTRVLLTVAIDSRQANEQALGRIRFIEDKKLDFIFFYAIKINKHCSYTKRRIALFKDKITKYTLEQYDRTIGR